MISKCFLKAPKLMIDGTVLRKLGSAEEVPCPKSLSFLTQIINSIADNQELTIKIETVNSKAMYTGDKNRLHPRSFRHRIKDGGAHYFDTNHFMGIDPLDHSKFHDIYEPPANMAQDENIFIIELMVPGFNEDQIEVLQQGNKLRILGSKEENEEESRDDYIIREHHVSKFQREFTLQGSTSPNHIETEMKNGTLKLTIHKVASEDT